MTGHNNSLMTVAEADALGLRTESVLMYPWEMLEFQPDGHQRLTQAEKDFCTQIGRLLSAQLRHQNLTDAYGSQFPCRHRLSIRAQSSQLLFRGKLGFSWLRIAAAQGWLSLFRLWSYRVYPHITPLPAKSEPDEHQVASS